MRKKAIVTGASRGIGKGIAMCLAEEGYDLAISYVSKKEEADKVVEQISETYHTRCSNWTNRALFDKKTRAGLLPAGYHMGEYTMRKIIFLFCVLMIVPTLALASDDMVSVSVLYL